MVLTLVRGESGSFFRNPASDRLQGGNPDHFPDLPEQRRQGARSGSGLSHLQFFGASVRSGDSDLRPGGRTWLAAGFRCAGENGSGRSEDDVDKLSEHAHRRSCGSRPLRKAGGLRSRSRDSCLQRQSLQFHPLRRALFHSGRAGRQGLLPGTEFPQQGPQHGWLEAWHGGFFGGGCL